MKLHKRRAALHNHISACVGAYQHSSKQFIIAAQHPRQFSAPQDDRPVHTAIARANSELFRAKLGHLHQAIAGVLEIELCTYACKAFNRT